MLNGIGGGGQQPVIGRVNFDKLVDDDGVLVASMTSPEMVADMVRAVAVVTDNGGALSHAAIVCTQRGIPFVVGTREATTTLEQGQYIEVNPAAGTVEVL